MSRKYYVWKDPACAGINIEWLELTGSEFYTFIKQPENKQRRFIRLGCDICTDADVLIVEATEEQYIDWKKEQNAHLYLDRTKRPYETASLDYPVGEAENDSLYEIISDFSEPVEDLMIAQIQRERLRLALKQLSLEELRLLHELYVEGKTTVELAEIYGVSQQAVSKRRIALLNKLRKIF